jgi:hypothetical protein
MHLYQMRKLKSSSRRISTRRAFRNDTVEFRGSTGVKKERRFYFECLINKLHKQSLKLSFGRHETPPTHNNRSRDAGGV